MRARPRSPATRPAHHLGEVAPGARAGRAQLRIAEGVEHLALAEGLRSLRRERARQDRRRPGARAQPLVARRSAEQPHVERLGAPAGQGGGEPAREIVHERGRMRGERAQRARIGEELGEEVLRALER
ncbi:MAG TPA: hypothetical protein VML57_15100, partial [Burkholderiales bacterium]|nr:hypothetical protein [Burkholderiales bacterium]